MVICTSATARCLDGFTKRPEDVEAEQRLIDEAIAEERAIAAKFGESYLPGLYLPPVLALAKLEPCT